MLVSLDTLVAQAEPVQQTTLSTPTLIPTMEPLRVNSDAIKIDGFIDEEAWARAHIATDFVQLTPKEGDPATERTEARVAYDENGLYVAIRAYESEPEKIASQLTRRDRIDDATSDFVAVGIDSYFDKRTAFVFMVNPSGVQGDELVSNDIEMDQSWDAVWDVATSRDNEGWSAEFRIPFSQLRFKKAEAQTWGISFIRTISRKGEMTSWAPLSMKEQALVSRFGELKELRDIRTPGRLELITYSMGHLRRKLGDKANPYYRKNDLFGTVGADIKYGVTSDLTLDLTINPDFGQIEADPGVMNLTAFETFLPERRPFFVEGASIFRFPLRPMGGHDVSESLFYSRRIGRAPQGDIDSGGGYVNTSDRTRILGAGKLSGKTANGWSIGVLNAVTSSESAKISPQAGAPYEEEIEPFTNYGMFRVQKDFRSGRSTLGAIGTSVNRSDLVAGQLGLHSAAYTGGIDFRHRFRDDVWQLSGYLLGSYVQGSEAAIARTQRSSARYYQRPDAQHVAYDPTRRSLSGSSADFQITKMGGDFWKGGAGVFTRAPGFEVNDLGFQEGADLTALWGWMGHHRTVPQGPFRMWQINANLAQMWNRGGDRLQREGGVTMGFELHSFWQGSFGVVQESEGLHRTMLRGGPLFKQEAKTHYFLGVSTNPRKKVQFRAQGMASRSTASDSWSLAVSPQITIRPTSRGTFSVGASVRHKLEDHQWVTRLDANDTHYLFGRIDQMTLGVTARMDYAFTPTLSLQLYAQPFTSSGKYSEFKRVTNPTADSYADRFEPLSVTSDLGRYHFDVDGDGALESFRNPDFNFKQFRSNLVLRWEYMPGSRLFLVWGQGRNHYDVGNSVVALDYIEDAKKLFGVHPDNVFMVKVSHWIGR